MSVRRFVFPGLAALVLATCGAPPRVAPPSAPATPVAPSPAVAVATTPAPDGIRLSTAARPLAYRLALDVDPALETFRGRVAIDIEVREAVNPLWLNAHNLTIASARVSSATGDRPLRVVAGPEGVIGLVGDRVLDPGRLTVELEYTGIQPTGQTDGMIRSEERGDWYVVTDLEPMGARRVAPCFDEPGFKVPWQLELTVPADLLAASNTPIARETPVAAGRRRVEFAPTQPIPSYLFAFAVGRFEAVDAGTTRGGAPMRILVPRGRTAEAAFMARQSGPLVAALEAYTGIPYPYEKLDHVVIPGRPGGAMENVGLITYAPRLLLIGDGESDAVRRTGIDFMAHELAHQWFGNLVTLAWWDDLWLNEAFSTWMADRLLADGYVGFGGALGATATRLDAIGAERDPSARAIRQPIGEKNDIGRAFDQITYAKGATVIHMFEQWLGADVFRAGVRQYLARHRGGNATAADFLQAIGEASQVDVATPFATWLDQPGAPIVSMALECPAGGPARVALRQRRYQLDGAAATGRWHIPICVRVPGESTPRCTLLTEAAGHLELGPRCPASIIPGPGGDYVSELSPDLRAALIRGWKQLSPAEQVAMAGDTSALVDLLQLDLSAALELLPVLTASSVPELAGIAIQTLGAVELEVAAPDRPAFARLVRGSVGKLARRVGWRPRAGEGLVAAAMRRRVVPLVARVTRDPALVREATALAHRWLDDHGVVPDSMWYPVLATAVAVGDGSLADKLLARLGTEPRALARRAMANALSAIRDPVHYRRVLEQVLAMPAISHELLGVFWANPVTQPVQLAFLRDHAPALLPKVGEDYRRWLAPSTCDPALRVAALEVIDTHFVTLPRYGAAERARWLAAYDACAAVRTRHAPQVAAYLRRHR